MESLPRSRWRLVRWIIAISFIFVLLLGLDLANQGLAWRLFWSQTGAEQPLGQLQGMLELGSNLLRAQPDTQPMQPIQYADDIPYGINTFLQKEVEEPKLRVMLQMIQEAGFVLFIAYGLVIGAYPVAVMNTFILLVNLYHLQQSYRETAVTVTPQQA